MCTLSCLHRRKDWRFDAGHRSTYMVQPYMACRCPALYDGAWHSCLYLSAQGDVLHLVLILASPAGVTDKLKLAWTCCTQCQEAAQTVYQQLIS